MQKKSSSAVFTNSSSFLYSLSMNKQYYTYLSNYSLKYIFLFGLLPLQYLFVMKFYISSHSNSIEGMLKRKHCTIYVCSSRQFLKMLSIDFLMVRQPRTVSLCHTLQNYLQYTKVYLQYLPMEFMLLLKEGKRRLYWFIILQRLPLYYFASSIFLAREFRYSYELDESLMRQDLQLLYTQMSLQGFPYLFMVIAYNYSKVSHKVSSQFNIRTAHMMIVYSFMIAASVVA